MEINPETWIKIIVAVAILIFLIYFIGSLFAKRSIIKSEWIDGTTISAAQLYYLPTASLSIKATTKVIVTKEKDTNNIINAQLGEIALETTVQIVPDTDNVFGLHYSPSIFSNDELTFHVNAMGLLEGVNLAAEDRISNIISQVAESPIMIIPGVKAVSSSLADTEEAKDVIIETKEYSRNFLILTREIRAKTCTRSWIINVDGTTTTNTTVDASFTLVFKDTATSMSFSNNAGKDFHLLTRPLQTIIMQVFKQRNAPSANPGATPEAEYQLTIPDESKIVSIPIKRSPFVKKVYGLKLTNGVFIENIINKPSEMEGFIGIPIKLAKAIASIPAQLFQFKIERINRVATLEKTQQDLVKARAQTKKENITAETDFLKASLDAQKALLNSKNEITKTQLESEKNLLDSQKALTTAKMELETATKKLEETLKKSKT